MSPREKLFIYLFIGLKTAKQAWRNESWLKAGVNKVALGLFFVSFLNYYDHDYYYNIIANYLFFLYGFQVE